LLLLRLLSVTASPWYFFRTNGDFQRSGFVSDYSRPSSERNKYKRKIA
jgi:hypothetical protein